MNITLYNCKDDKRTVNKNLGATLGSCTIIPTDTISMLNPIFIVSRAEFNFNANYVYCDTFNRYYFIDNVRVLSAQRVEIQCAVDVLYSHKEEILNCKTVATRNENTPLNNIVDRNVPILSAKQTRLVRFSKNPFNVESIDAYSPNFLLITSGGGKSNGNQ